MANSSSDSTDKVKAALPKHRSLYYAGAWREPLGGYSQTVNPATGEVLGELDSAGPAEVHAAAARARAAQPGTRVQHRGRRGGLDLDR